MHLSGWLQQERKGKELQDRVDFCAPPLSGAAHQLPLEPSAPSFTGVHGKLRLSYREPERTSKELCLHI